MKVALVHEFLIQMGGAEKLLREFHDMFPDAPVFTLFYDRRRTEGAFDGWDIRTSFLQKIPGALAHYKWFLPLMPRAIERFDLSGYDLILSDSSAFAMGAVKGAGAKHICYCHTPTRYIWENHDEYIANLPYPKIIQMLAHLYIKNHQARWDVRASQRPDYFIANSRTVQNRIKKYYGRDSTVIYPPVDTDFFVLKSTASSTFYLTGSRIEPYKKIDLVVDAFNELGFNLKIAGDGTQLEELRMKNKESRNIEFLGRVSDEQLRSLYQGARAFVFPALEDAGLMVLEALACGTPVIGLNQGGTAEFVRDSENGVLFSEQSAAAIKDAVKRFDNFKFDPSKLRQSAIPFDKLHFRAKILEFIDRVCA